jgi:membrane associated rhomboid family serine protease
MSYQQYRPSRFQVLPLVVKNLLIINGLFFLATWVFMGQYQIDLTDYLGLHNFNSSNFRIYQFITYMFMHGSFEHILFNMFALWMFGNVLENFWGSKRFLIYYMVTGIGAALIYLCYQSFEFYQIHSAAQNLLNNPSPEEYIAILRKYFEPFYETPELQMHALALAEQWSKHIGDVSFVNTAVSDINQLISIRENMPMVGASGAVFGILLAFGMLFPNTLLYIYFLIPIKAKYFVILYGVAELFLGIANNPADNVAHFAHLGGMLFGFILIKYWQKKSKTFY